MKKLENKYINNSISELFMLFKVWRSKEYAGTSRFIKVYENKLAEYFSINYAAAVSNGTDAIEVAIRSLGIKSGSEIMMPAYAPVMSVIPLLHYGIKPVFVDCEPNKFNLSLEDIKSKKTAKTAAILVVPMWGYPINMTYLKIYCKKNKIFLIEDASHCHGSKIGNSFVGTLSDISTFSTQERKMIATGEGGFILTNHSTINNKVLSVRDFGKVQINDKKYPNNIGEYGYYDGSNFRISAASSALGIVQLDKLKKKIAIRTHNAQIILRAIKSEKRYKELRNITNTHNNYYSLVLLTNGLDVNKLGAYLSSKNITSDTYRFKIKPLYQMNQYAMYATNCPNTEELLNTIITVPTHEGLTANDISLITLSLLEFAKKYN